MLDLSAMRLNTSWSIPPESQIQIARYFLPFYVLNMVLSNMVNTVIIAVTIRCKEMRSVSNILIAVQAAGDMITTWEVPVYAYHTLTRQMITCHVCFLYQLVPILGMNLATMTILVLGVDRLLNLTRPAWHMRLNRNYYLLTLLFIYLTYSLSVTFLIYKSTSSTESVCFISDAFAGLGKDTWAVTQCFINIAVIVVYRKAKKAVKGQNIIKDHMADRIFKSLYIIMVFYIGGWVTTVVLVLAVRVVITDPRLTEAIELGIAVFAASNLCVPFFVYYYRSPLYRREIHRLLRWNDGIGPLAMLDLSVIQLNTSWSISAETQIQIARYFLPHYILQMVVCNIVNTIIIAVTVRCKEMRSVSNILIAVQAAADMITTWEGPVFFYHTLAGKMITCHTCFRYHLIPILFMNLATLTILVLGVDRLLNVTRPVWYRQLNRNYYLTTLFLLYRTYSIPVTALVFKTTTSTESVRFISDAFAGLGKDTWVVTQCFVNTAVIVIYRKAKKAVKEHTMISTRLTEILELGIAVFAASNLCVPFFVYYYRSPLYRREIHRLLHFRDRIVPNSGCGNKQVPHVVATPLS